MGGKTFNLEDDKKILEIKSPEDKIRGPYIVVFKSIKERWAIVAMEFDEEPRLGIRWFHGKYGTPLSSSKPIWLVIPPALSKNILAGLPLNHQSSSKIDEFLSDERPPKKLDGNELKEWWKTQNLP